MDKSKNNTKGTTIEDNAPVGKAGQPSDFSFSKKKKKMSDDKSEAIKRRMAKNKGKKKVSNTKGGGY